MLNGKMSGRLIRHHCQLDSAGADLLRNAIDDLGLSARAHDRILRVARTIADLEGSADILDSHVAEAVGYRTLDRKLWKT
jgi:magnesium chelatase family protein